MSFSFPYVYCGSTQTEAFPSGHKSCVSRNGRGTQAITSIFAHGFHLGDKDAIPQIFCKILNSLNMFLKSFQPLKFFSESVFLGNSWHFFPQSYQPSQDRINILSVGNIMLQNCSCCSIVPWLRLSDTCWTWKPPLEATVRLFAHKELLVWGRENLAARTLKNLPVKPDITLKRINKTHRRVNKC